MVTLSNIYSIVEELRLIIRIFTSDIFNIRTNKCQLIENNVLSLMLDFILDNNKMALNIERIKSFKQGKQSLDFFLFLSILLKSKELQFNKYSIQDFIFLRYFLSQVCIILFLEIIIKFSKSLENVFNLIIQFFIISQKAGKLFYLEWFNPFNNILFKKLSNICVPKKLNFLPFQYLLVHLFIQ